MRNYRALVFVTSFAIVLVLIGGTFVPITYTQVSIKGTTTSSWNENPSVIFEEQSFIIDGWMKFPTIEGFGILGPIWQVYNKTFNLKSFNEVNYFKIETPARILIDPNLVLKEESFIVPLNITVHQVISYPLGSYKLKASGFSVYLGVGFRDNKRFPESLLKYIEIECSPINIGITKYVGNMFDLILGKWKVHNYYEENLPLLFNAPSLYESYFGKFLMVGEWGRKPPGALVYNNTVCYRYPSTLNTKTITQHIIAIYYLNCKNKKELEEYMHHGLEFYVLIQFGWWLIGPDGKKVGRVVVTRASILGDGFPHSYEHPIVQVSNWNSINQVSWKAGVSYLTPKGKYRVKILIRGHDSWIRMKIISEIDSSLPQKESGV